MKDIQIETIGKLRAENYTYAGIGKMLGMSANTVKSICRKYSFAPDANTRKKNVNQAVAFEHQPRCKYCANVITNPWNRKGKEFCSDKCRYSWWNRERRIMGYVPIERRQNLSKKTLDFQGQKRD